VHRFTKLPRHLKAALLALLITVLAIMAVLVAPQVAQAQVLVPPGPPLSLAPTQPADAAQRTITATPPASWVATGSYFAASYAVAYTANATATTPDNLSFGLVASDANPPLDQPWNATVDLTGADPAVDLYVMEQASLQNGFTSQWSVPFLIWGPDYVAPTPTPSPSPTPTPTPTTPPPPPDPLALAQISIVAAPADAVLRRQIRLTPADTTTVVKRYEYAWGTSPTHGDPGAIQRCSATAAKCTLDYRPVSPNTTWDLYARLVSSTGAVGPWLITKVAIPSSPAVISGGDSVASGHNRLSEGVPTTCQDPTFAYGYTVWRQLQATLPPQWRDPNSYYNVAKSGFGTLDMLQGGVDACGFGHLSELSDAVDALHYRAGSWNVVMWDGGINNTNWGGILGRIIGDNITGAITTAKKCQSYLDAWNLATDANVGRNLTSDVYDLSSRLRAADPDAKLFWTSYYNVAGTGTLFLRVPAACASPMSKALKLLEGYVRPTIEGQGFRWVNLNGILGQQDSLLQDLYPSDAIFLTSGWPHPNQTGAAFIGQFIARLT